MRLRVVRLAAGLAAALTAAFAAAAPLQNGSFETGSISNPFSALGTGSTAITGWTVSSGSIDYIGNYWVSAEGSRSVDLAGTGPGAISQTFDTVPGLNYQVDFMMAGNPGCGSSTKTLQASAGASSQSFAFDTSGFSTTNMGWSPRTFYFAANASSTTLTFTDTGSSPCGAAVDAVTVRAIQQVPVTHSAFGAFLGLALLAALVLRRRARVG